MHPMIDSKEKSQERKYPHLKVIIGFGLCPFYVSFLIALLISLMVFFGESNQDGFLNRLFGLLVLTLLTTGKGGGVYLAPAVILSCIYSYFRINRTGKSVLLVSVLGGLGAHLWGYGVLFPKNASFFPGIFIPDIGFLLGFLSSLFAGMVFLPKRISYSGANGS